MSAGGRDGESEVHCAVSTANALHQISMHGAGRMVNQMFTPVLLRSLLIRFAPLLIRAGLLRRYVFVLGARY
jgi:hypothetical protein